MQSDAEAHPEVQRSFQTDKEMIDALPGLDVLIGGHAHRGIEVPWRSEKTGGIVVQTYGRGTTLGFLQLEIDVGSHKVLRHSGSLIRVAPGVFPPNPQVVAVVKKWEQQIDTEGKEVVGRANTPLNRDYNAESMLGDVIADAMLWKTKADIAFENAGGIRADLPQGAITRYDAVSVLPFVNTAVEMRLNGEQVRQVIEQALTLKTGMAQMAGLHVKYDISQPEYSRAISITVNGAELDAKREYNVVASSFIAGGGDHYAAFLLGKDIHDTGILLDDVLTEYLKAKSPIESPTQDRLVPQSSAVRTAH
jgi:2',3'-cyclic-nucleotide 2'-phosphodiesterase (5'-nucleotidase family)